MTSKRFFSNKKVTCCIEGPSLTDESFKQECDIGFIVENYLKTGQGIPASTMNYADCTTVQDFQEAQMLVAEAKSNFEQLPSKDRDRFKTVENYLEFICNTDNLKESYEKGYIDPSTVDLVDVYPERYTEQPLEEKTAVTEPSVEPSADSKPAG